MRTIPGDVPKLIVTVYNFCGQRADKIRVKDVEIVDDVRRPDGTRGKAVAKEIEHYTITCDECGGTGRYDELGDVVCEDCGLILSGDRQSMLPVDYSASRGFSKDQGSNAPGHEEPS